MTSTSPTSLAARAAAPARIVATGVGIAMALLLCLSLPASASAARCEDWPTNLSPGAKGADGYTMILRVNEPDNVNRYFETVRNQLRDRDIFMVNTRYKGSNPETWAEIVHRINVNFPCNRIIALNGLHRNASKPGYMFALANDPTVWGLSIDWEAMDWTQSQRMHRSTPAWTTHFPTSRSRITRRLNRIGKFSTDRVGEPGLRTGVVPAWYGDWDYGLLGKKADDSNFARKDERRGFQIVQSQGFCSNEDQSTYAPALNDLISQYYPAPRIRKIRDKKGKVIKTKKIPVPPRGIIGTLAGEISFTTTPNPNTDQPVRSVGVRAASRCTRLGLGTGVRAFLYWAHPTAIDALMESPRICRIRKPCR